MHLYNIEIQCLDIQESKKFYTHIFDFLNSKNIPISHSEDILRFDTGDYGKSVVYWGNAEGIPSIKLVEIEKVRSILTVEYRLGLIKFSINLKSNSLLNDLNSHLDKTMKVGEVKESEFVKGLFSFSVNDPSGSVIEFLSV